MRTARTTRVGIAVVAMLVMAAAPALGARQGTDEPDEAAFDRCVEACQREGKPRGDCLDFCRDSVRRGERVQDDEAGETPATPGLPAPGPAPTPGTSMLAGRYACPTCPRAQSWKIENHVLYWEGQPFIPVAGFWTNPSHPREITTFNLWIDEDRLAAGASPAQYLRELDQITSEISRRGHTYILLLAYPPAPRRDATWLFDARAVGPVVQGWQRLAPVIAKPGLRALLLFNEVNAEWSWPASRTANEYGRALASLALQAQQAIGQVPVLFKTSGVSGGFQNVLAGARATSGLGVDLFPRSCGNGRFGPPEAEKALSVLSGNRPSGLFWATEFGKRSPKTEEELQGRPLWEGYEPYANPEELRCHIDRWLAAGVTGFVFVVPGHDYGGYRWFGALKPMIEARVLGR